MIAEVQNQLKQVKADLDSKITTAVADLDSKITTAVTDLDTKISSKMTKQVETLSAHVETVRTGLETQSEVVKQLQSDVRNLTEMAMEQQRQAKESQ